MLEKYPITSKIFGFLLLLISIPITLFIFYMFLLGIGYGSIITKKDLALGLIMVAIPTINVILGIILLIPSKKILGKWKGFTLICIIILDSIILNTLFKN